MEIDAVKRGPLTTEEQKHCCDLGLCMYCGASGHKLEACPFKPNHTEPAHAATPSTAPHACKGKAKLGTH